MPKWGLTEAQRNSKPWGLAAELLEPAKTLTDPIHGDIFLNRLEVLFLDSPPLQRLRRVRQLGTTYLVYPAATHTRLSHALGALRAAQDLMDSAIGNRESPHRTPDLLDAWMADESFTEKWAEATVLARLGALLHDMAHVPFGHTIEDDLELLSAHDENATRLAALWAQFPAAARDAVAAGGLDQELRALILSKEHLGDGEEWESRYPFVADVVGNTICADLLDYIRRDHFFTGLPMAVGDRFEDDFYVIPPENVHYAGRMAIRVTRNGRTRSDIVTELLKYLRYRYELSERALYHHAKVGADAMIGKLLEMWGDAEWVAAARAVYPELGDAKADDIDSFRDQVAAIDVERVDAVNREVHARLETALITRSDDGLLEHICDQASSHPDDRRWRAIGDVATRVLNRELFKSVGWADGRDARALATKLYSSYRSPDARRRIEREAATFAGLDRRFHVVLWVPNPDMKLKVAGVLVDANGQIMPLSRFTQVGEDIVTAHRELWAIGVYAPGMVRNDVRGDALLAFFSERMGVGFRRPDGTAAGTPRELAIKRCAVTRNLTMTQHAALESLVPAAMSATTFADIESLVVETARANKLGRASK